MYNSTGNVVYLYNMLLNQTTYRIVTDCVYIPPLEFHTKILVLCVHSAGIYEHHFVPRAPWSIKIPYIILASVLGSGTVMEAYRYSTAFWIRIQVVKKHVKKLQKNRRQLEDKFQLANIISINFPVHHFFNTIQQLSQKNI